MGKYIFIGLLFTAQLSWTQSIYLSDKSNNIYAYDFANCTADHIYHLNVEDTLQDLAMGPDGALYAITNQGHLYEIDFSEQNHMMLHSFLNLQDFTSLYCRVDGLMYTSGSEGFLYSFDIYSREDLFLGDVGFTTTGDLISHRGSLYGSTENLHLAHLEVETPSESKLAMQNITQSIISGFFTYDPTSSDPCSPAPVYGITSQGEVFAMDFAQKKIESVCQLNLSITGATGSQDQLDFAPLAFTNLLSSPTACDVASGQVSLSVHGGTGIYRYSLSGGELQDEALFTDLAAGVYDILVESSDACLLDSTITIGTMAAPILDDVLLYPPKCLEGNGVIEILANGNGPLEYALDKDEFGETNTISNVETGAHLITVQDTNNCQMQDSIFMPTETDFFFSKLEIEPASCHADNGLIEARMQGNPTTYSYMLNGKLSNNGLFSHLTAGTYVLEVTDGKGCSLDTSIVVLNESCPVYIPSAFSPDQDGMNDLFKLYSEVQTPMLIKSYQIFDRWGGAIYQAKNFSIHSEAHWWNGSVEGHVPNDILYVYVIEVQKEDGTQAVYKGHISIVK